MGIDSEYGDSRPAGMMGVGIVVFLANAALLVLQLVAGRLLAPFVGSSLETWTSVIGAFLSGIALGNFVGGRVADSGPNRLKLSLFLAFGAITAFWMLALPLILKQTTLHRFFPLSIRIPVLACALCLPPGFALSLLTPLAIRLAVPDLRHAGRVTGTVFAISTFGCLVGNYATGFFLIPSMTVNTLVTCTGSLLFITAVVTLIVVRRSAPSAASGENSESTADRQPSEPEPITILADCLTVRRACVVVFLSSFSSMGLELAATRLVAQVLGVSLFTMTGVIGVMLAGTALGNYIGGRIADRAGKRKSIIEARYPLAACLIFAAVSSILALLLFIVFTTKQFKLSDYNYYFYEADLIIRVLAWTLLLFPAMFWLGTISPQAIRLAMPDVAHTGRVAGRIYAWSTLGAIAGTFATGFLLLSTIGVNRMVLLTGLLPLIASLLVAKIWKSTPMLYSASVIGGIICGGFILNSSTFNNITKETNYYTIQVQEHPEDPDLLNLVLDTLLHSTVSKSDPTFLYYLHEAIQVELLQSAAAKHPNGPRVLVIGGGGYTFPRAGRTIVPNCKMDVVEIDPGVTEVAYSHLYLDPKLEIKSYHMDGRQFVAEKSPPGHYHLITLDAVNDLTVPAHLLTVEFNRDVKQALTHDGVYLLTVIDHLSDGQLWRAAVHTLRTVFPHVEILSAESTFDPASRAVYVIYASNNKLDLQQLAEAAFQQRKLPSLAAGGTLMQSVTFPALTHRLPNNSAEGFLNGRTAIILSDQFAPVDNMMAEVFRRRRTNSD